MASPDQQDRANAVPIESEILPRLSPVVSSDFLTLKHDSNRAMAIRVVNTAEREEKENGHSSPMQRNSGLRYGTARSSSAYNGPSLLHDDTTEIPLENQPATTQRLTDSPQPYQKLQFASSPSKDLEVLPTPTFSEHTNQRVNPPRVVTPDMGANSSTQRRRGSHENGKNSGSHDSSSTTTHPNVPLEPTESPQPLQYHHQQRGEASGVKTVERKSPGTPGTPPTPPQSSKPRLKDRDSFLAPSGPRPTSSYSSYNDRSRDRHSSPGFSPNRYARTPSSQGRRTPDNRPLSYIDLLSVPYPQHAPTAGSLDKAHLETSVGTRASLLSTKKTLEMYRANVKKTNDPAVQYAFAIFMFETAQEATQSGIDVGSESDPLSPVELTKEARGILQALADRSYPFAQYYLADGYASGVFNKGKVDNDKAFPLFVSASKHGHAEAGYRAALCYEYGWGTRVNGQKAVQFYRQSASKNHPGAMTRLGRACLMSDLGLEKRYREGITWLKRASESADPQYNQAPYELGLMHESGYGADVFKDESYAVQLFTQAAELGHVEANHRLGEAYEHGRLSCPRDPALSVHFYNGAAAKGHAPAMMALCAWYMVGVDGFLPKDENEAYEWAKKAAVLGLPKAEYAVGYFTESGIGCRRDPLEANVWYVRAADNGEERAKQRIAAIRAAAAGQDAPPKIPKVPKTPEVIDAPSKNGNDNGIITPPDPRVDKGKGVLKPLKGSEEKKPKKWGIF